MKHRVCLKPFLLLLFFTIVHGHGFDKNTLVHCRKSSCAIERVHKIVSKDKDAVVSFNISLAIEELENEVHTAKSSSNCYFRIRCDQSSYNDIVCTPSQEFYLPIKAKWVPAYELNTGDVLYSKFSGWVEITNIEFCEKPLEVYGIEVKNNHNYFVGKYGVLTHNMFVPVVYSVATGAIFSSGAAAGGMATGCFGPIAAIGGAALGGIIGVVIKKIVQKCSMPEYHLLFDADKIKETRNSHSNETADGVKADGAQAPGKPTENDGFVPKKNWDGKKVRHPKTGQHGWADQKGDIWVPTGPGPRAHGGAHWDVVKPNGIDYDNVYPGGKVRKGKR